jgi:hypothetical protein
LDEIDVEGRHQEDVDLKRFKKIDIMSIKEPRKTTDTVEEMMNLILRFKNSGEALSAQLCASVMETVALIRAEAQLDVTIFDFDKEDNLFFDHSQELVQSLSTVISTSNLSDIDLCKLSSRINAYRN